MSFASGFNQGYFSGTGSQTSLVPSIYDVALAGHPYLIDKTMTFARIWRHETIPVLTPTTKTSDQLGEASINPAGLWRSSAATWNKGAGQVNVDLSTSDPARFRSSKGVDVWTQWQLSLLPDTDLKLTSANTNLQLLVVGTYLYVSDGAALKFTTNITVDTPTWTTVTGTSGIAITGLASDGYQVWITDGATVYITARGGATAASWNTQDADILGYAKGRLLASKGPLAFNITSSTVKVDLHDETDVAAGTDFDWVGFAEGLGCVYMAGFSGDKSRIFRSTIKTDGTGLEVAAMAGELPDGEIVRSIFDYLGFVVIGTDNGIRFATADQAGNLTLGALIQLNAAVYCFEGQGQYVWFGWTNYDGTSTGLGRLDLTVVNGTAPAYASDLMVTTQGAVKSVATFQGLRVLTVSGHGVYAETTAKVASGTLDSGQISYGVGDQKIALTAELRHLPLPAGSVAVSVAVDGGIFDSLGSSDVVNSTSATFPVGEKVGEKFETRLLLEGSGTEGPTVTRLTLLSDVRTDTGFRIVLPVEINQVDHIDGVDYPRNCASEIGFIEGLRASRDVVLLQEMTAAYSATLEDYEFLPNGPTTNRDGLQGVAVLTLKVAR